jgi:glycosyltransferase involved in cell wall biosynthesis
MKTILFVSHSAELNGAERWLLETLRGLDRRSYRALLVLPRGGPLDGEAAASGIETFVVPAKWWLTEKSEAWRQPAAWLWNRRFVRRLSRLVRERAADLVFSNSAATFGGALAARRAGVPHVWAVHEILRGERALLRYFFGGEALTRFVLKHSAKVIVNSETTRAGFPPSDKLVLVPNGIEVGPGDPARRAALRSAFGLEEGEPAVAVVGKIYPGKGQREAVEAVSLLSAKYPRLRLFLVGEVKDGRYADEISALIRRRSLENRVASAGYIADLPDFLKLMSAVVVASVVESFGRAALEGMAAGVPVLAVKAGGLKEIIEPGGNGFLADSREPAVLAAALDELLSAGPERLRAVVEGGFKTIREKFSLRAQVRGVERVLAEILGGTLWTPPGRGAGPDGPFFAGKERGFDKLPEGPAA